MIGRSRVGARGTAMDRMPDVVRACRAIGFVVMLLAPCGYARSQERDVAAEFKAAKAGLTAQLRGKRANRLEAVHRLESFPTVDAAKLLFAQGLDSGELEVRRATFDVLAKFSSDKEVAEFLKS